jgi:hypothetical protein
MFCRFGLTDESRPVAVEVFAWIDQRREHVDIGVLEFRDLTILQHLCGDRKTAREPGQHFDTGCVAGLVLAAVRQAEVVEEDASELLRRADVERLAGRSVNRALQPFDVGIDARAQIDKRGRIERNAGAFDLRQHHGNGNLDVRIEAELLAPLEFDARDAGDA